MSETVETQHDPVAVAGLRLQVIAVVALVIGLVLAVTGWIKSSGTTPVVTVSPAWFICAAVMVAAALLLFGMRTLATMLRPTGSS